MALSTRRRVLRAAASIWRPARGVTGSANTVNGFFAGNAIQGSGNVASGALAGNTVIGNSNVAIGSPADISAIDAVGTGRFVTGNNNIALGSSAGAGSLGNPLTASNTISIGTNAKASADGAVAIGSGAQTSLNNQFMLGTSSHTYTAPGITSANSTSRQSGPLEIVSSDGGGNLATATAGQLGLATSADVSSLQSNINRLGSTR